MYLNRLKLNCNCYVSSIKKNIMFKAGEEVCQEEHQNLEETRVR
jgi:hypothetical protein